MYDFSPFSDNYILPWSASLTHRLFEPPEGGSLTYSNDFTNVATYQCNDELQLTPLRLG